MKNITEIQSKLTKLLTTVSVTKDLDEEGRLVLQEAIDWLQEWGDEQDRLYEERTGKPFPKLKGTHECS